MRYFAMGLLPPFHERDEATEEIGGIVRTGGGLGMVLHGEDRQLPVAHALAGSVVQVDVTFLDAEPLHPSRVDGEAVVLSGDLAATGREVLDGMIAPVVAGESL
jgi:hypothetical protein